MFIYLIKNNINGKQYIGQTRRSIEQRMCEHQRDAISGRGHYISHAIAKYGWDNFTVNVLAETDSIDELNRLEEYYIRKYNTVECGYNLCYGGNSNTMDCEVSKSIHDEKMNSDDVKSRISSTMKSRLSSDKTLHTKYVNNLLSGMFAYRQTDKYKEDLRNRKLSPEHYKALNDAKNKEVYCVDESGNEVARFKRVKDAAVWWWHNGYSTVKRPDILMDRIKESSKCNKYIRGLKWIYCA
jgi:group I intron endonuclease|nr:MAG TPA: intron associated endonuclease [Bacteriophage sp.]